MKIIDDSDEYITLSELKYGDVFKFGEKFYVKINISAFTDSNIQYKGEFAAISLNDFSIVRFVNSEKTSVNIYDVKEIHIVRKKG